MRSFPLGVIITVFHTIEFCDAPEFTDMLLYMTDEKEVQGFLHCDFMISQVGPGIEAQHPELVAVIKDINIAFITGGGKERQRAIADAVTAQLAEKYGETVDLEPLANYDNSHEANMAFVQQKAQEMMTRMAANKR